MNSSGIIRYRLYNQHLSARHFTDAADVVRYMGAVQAQDFAAAKWALGLRLDNNTDNDIEGAFNNGTILRTHLMRPTWHFVAPGDIRWLLALSAPRVKAQCAFGYRQCSLDDTIFKRSNKVLTKALSGGKHLTRDQLIPVFQKAGIATNELRLIHLMMRAELDGIVCSGPRTGKQFTYALLEERVPPAKTLSREEALAKLAKQYFTSHGPATLQDFAWWSGLTMTDSKAALKMIATEFISEQIGEQEYWFSSSLQDPNTAPGQALLLPNYDEYIISYKDRSNLVDPKANVVLDSRGNVIFNHTILLNGKIAGTWKRTVLKNSVELNITPFIKLNKAQHAAINTAAKLYGTFINKTAVLVS